MANELRNEFEQMGKAMAEEILKGLVLEDLKDIYSKYQEQYEKYLEVAKSIEEIREKNDTQYTKFTKKNEEQYISFIKATLSVNDTATHLEKEANNVQSTILNVTEKTTVSIEALKILLNKIENDTKSLFSQMKQLNDQSKEDFLKSLSECFGRNISDFTNNIDLKKNELKNIIEKEKNDFIISLSIQKQELINDIVDNRTELEDFLNIYKSDFSKTILERESSISDKLAGVITPELLREFLDELKNSTEETKRLVSFVDIEYKSEIEKSIKDIVEANRKAMVETDTRVSESVDKILDDIKMVHNQASDDIGKNVSAFEASIIQKLEEIFGYLSDLTRKEKQLRDKAIEQERALISQIEPSQKRLDVLEAKIGRMEKIVLAIESEKDEYYRKIGLILKNLSNQQVTAGSFTNKTIPNLLQKCYTKWDIIDKREELMLKEIKNKIDSIPESSVKYLRKYNLLFMLMIALGIVNLIVVVIMLIK